MKIICTKNEFLKLVRSCESAKSGESNDCTGCVFRDICWNGLMCEDVPAIEDTKGIVFEIEDFTETENPSADNDDNKTLLGELIVESEYKKMVGMDFNARVQALLDRGWEVKFNSERSMEE